MLEASRVKAISSPASDPFGGGIMRASLKPTGGGLPDAISLMISAITAQPALDLAQAQYGNPSGPGADGRPLIAAR